MNPTRVFHRRGDGAGVKKGNVPWNKGNKTGYTWNKGKKTGVGHPCSESHKKILSELAIKRGLGGYNEKSGRGKSGRYKGIWCSSSWELAFVIFCDEKNIPIERARVKRSYIWKGQKRNYYPDFKNDDIIIEIKGWTSDQWKAKHIANPDVVLLDKYDMKPVLDFVIDKYGKNFVSLYDKED